MLPNVFDWSDLLVVIPWPGERRLTAFLTRHPSILIGTLLVIALLVGGAIYISKHGG